MAEQHGEGPSSYAQPDYNTPHTTGGPTVGGGALGEYGGNTQGFQNAVNARVVENM